MRRFLNILAATAIVSLSVAAPASSAPIPGQWSSDNQFVVIPNPNGLDVHKAHDRRVIENMVKYAISHADFWTESSSATVAPGSLVVDVTGITAGDSRSYFLINLDEQIRSARTIG